MKRRWLIGVGVFVSLCLAVLPAPAASQYNNLAAAQGNWLRGYIDVPAGRMWLSLESRFGTGDCDLYLRYGAAPTTSSYLKRSVRNATNLEYLRVDNPAAGRYYFGIYAYRTFSRVSFRAEWANTAEALAEPLASPACGGRHEGFCK